MNKNIRYIVLSDIHFGNPRNRSVTIEEHLDHFFKVNRKILTSLDIIFLAGDIFDGVLNGDSIDYTIAITWLSKLAFFCKKHGIKLRILEGTASHDAKQCAAFIKVLDNLELSLDYKYIDKLFIEYMTDLDFTILYVPDEVNADASKTLEEVKIMYADKGIDKVDIAIMHGSFNYRYRGLELKSTHDEHEYLKLVSRFISIGHEHTKSIYERIIGQGSFDRLAHGEEEDKGCVYIKLDKDSKDLDEYVFMVNTESTIFKTILVKTSDTEEFTTLLKDALSNIPIGSHISFKLDKGNHVVKSIPDIVKQHPGYRFTTTIVDETAKETSLSTALGDDTCQEVLHIHKDNISQLVTDELSLRDYSETLIRIAKSELLAVLNECA